jgi:putative ABC transport system substrate-binding protein
LAAAPTCTLVGQAEEDTTKSSTAALSVTLALGILLAPLAVAAQQTGRVWRIGLMHVGLDHPPRSVDTFRETMKALGYEEGMNLRLDFRNLANEEAAHATAREFVRNRVDVIVAFENQTARAAKTATFEIPVVFVHVTDPVADGLVKSLSRPGGNLTGFAGLGDVPAKRLELFKELVPRLRRVLVLIEPQDPVTRRVLREVEKAGAALKLPLVEREVSHEADIQGVFRSLKRGEVDGVFVASPNLYSKFSSLILRLASERHIPVASHWKGWVEQGALFSYSGNLQSVGGDAARYVDKILKGAKPADLPVQELSRFELVVNLKTAKALGLMIPQSVLIRADQAIR